MELHNDQVPGDTVWALETDYGNLHIVEVDWYLTPEMSSEEYRHAVGYMKTHSGGTCKRWKISLPRRGMERDEVADYILGKLSEDPDGTTQLLDVSVQKTKEE
ncbi:MAG: hypothetical protein ACXVYB_00140 [Arthrobacter sp.]